MNVYGSYGGVRPQFGYSPNYTTPAPTQTARPNVSQLLSSLQGLFQAMQQMAAGWQGFLSHPGQQMLPFGAQQGVQQVGWSQNPGPYSGPIGANSNPYSLLPGGQGSAPSAPFYPTQISQVGPRFGYPGPVAPNPAPYSLLPAGYGSF